MTTFSLYTSFMNKVAIGLVGSMVSGKGTVAKYLQGLGFTYESLSDRVREEALRRHVPLTRTNLQNIGNDLRLQFGPHILAERTLEILGDQTDRLVLDGIRNPAEIDFLKQALGLTVMAIDAPVEMRLEWYLQRAEGRGEDAPTEAGFFVSNNRDFGIGEPDAGQQVQRCLAKADILIENNGSKKHLLAEVDYHLILDLGFSPEGARREQEKK